MPQQQSGIRRTNGLYDLAHLGRRGAQHFFGAPEILRRHECHEETSR
jgi:hypothetical protein